MSDENAVAPPEEQSPSEPVEEQEDEEENLGDGSGSEQDSGQVPAIRPNPLEQQLSSSAANREKGMKAYQDGSYEEAVEAWSMSRGSLKYIIDKNLLDSKPEELAEVKKNQFIMHLNLAQAFLKQQEWRQAIEYCDRALLHESNNTKALYRKACALSGGDRFTEARVVLEKLKAIDGDNSAAKQLVQELDRKEKLANKTAKQAARRIFEGMESTPDPRASDNVSMANKFGDKFNSITDSIAWGSHAFFTSPGRGLRSCFRSLCKGRKKNH